MGKYNTLGDRIKCTRQKLGLSQAELAQRLNCTQAALSQYENGNREPSLGDLCNIARQLNTTTDYLLGQTNIASKEPTIKAIGDYLGFTEETIEKLHSLFVKYEVRTHEDELQKEVEEFGGRTPGSAGYEDDYGFVKGYAFLDLNDHIKIINEFICSHEFSTFIYTMKNNLFLERQIYDVLRIAAKRYADLESPVYTKNFAEIACCYSEEGEDNLKRYSLNLFDAQNALIDFCRNFTKLEIIKKADDNESLYRKIHFYIYLSTSSMSENKDYSVEKMEKGLSENVASLLPTITELLDKKR